MNYYEFPEYASDPYPPIKRKIFIDKSKTKHVPDVFKNNLL